MVPVPVQRHAGTHRVLIIRLCSKGFHSLAGSVESAWRLFDSLLVTAVGLADDLD